MVITRDPYHSKVSTNRPGIERHERSPEWHVEAYRML